jgi:hypothetical protein
MRDKHRLNTIQTNNFNIIKQEEAVIRKAIVIVYDFMFIAKGSAMKKCDKNTNSFSVDVESMSYDLLKVTIPTKKRSSYSWF